MYLVKNQQAHGRRVRAETRLDLIMALVETLYGLKAISKRTESCIFEIDSLSQFQICYFQSAWRKHSVQKGLTKTIIDNMAWVETLYGQLAISNRTESYINKIDLLSQFQIYYFQ